MGSITTRNNPYMSTTKFVDMSDQDAMLINEVIYDLISERILTPGIDRSNLEWPFLSVTNMEKLKQKITQLSEW